MFHSLFFDFLYVLEATSVSSKTKYYLIAGIIGTIIVIITVGSFLYFYDKKRIKPTRLLEEFKE